MEIDRTVKAGKPEIDARHPLPNRRPAVTFAFEIFLTADRPDSLLDVLASDAAIIASIALQFGCPLDAIRHALKRDGQGVAASPIGEALDRIEP